MKRLSLFTSLGALCLCHSAWAIDIPHIGYARDTQGLVHPIDGVSGNFLVGDPVASDAAVAFASNGIFGIRKTDTSLEWWDASATKRATLDAPPGGVVIGYDRSNSQTAWIYSKTARTLCEVTTQWRMVDVPVSLLTPEQEEVLAVAGGRDSVDIALRRGSTIFVATFDIASGSRTAETALNVPSSSHLLLLQDGSILGTKRLDHMAAPRGRYAMERRRRPRPSRSDLDGHRMVPGIGTGAAVGVAHSNGERSDALHDPGAAGGGAMRRLWLVASPLPPLGRQVQFYTPSGTLLSGSYSPSGSFIVGVKQTININVQTTQAVCIVLATASGSGFLLETPTPDTPSALAVGGTMTLPLDFTATILGKGASANLEVQYLPLAQSNGCNGPGIPAANLLKADLFVLVNSIATGATVSLQPGGAQVASIPFGTVAVSQTSQIEVYLNNPGSTPITIRRTERETRYAGSLHDRRANRPSR